MAPRKAATVSSRIDPTLRDFIRQHAGLRRKMDEVGYTQAFWDFFWTIVAEELDAHPALYNRNQGLIIEEAAKGWVKENPAPAPVLTEEEEKEKQAVNQHRAVSRGLTTLATVKKGYLLEHLKEFVEQVENPEIRQSQTPKDAMDKGIIPKVAEQMAITQLRLEHRQHEAEKKSQGNRRRTTAEEEV